MVSSARKLWATVHLIREPSQTEWVELIEAARRYQQAWQDDAGVMMACCQCFPVKVPVIAADAIMAFLPLTCNRVWLWSQHCQRAGRRLRPNCNERAALSRIKYACGVLGLTPTEATATKARLCLRVPMREWNARDLIASHFEWLLREHENEVYYLLEHGY